MAEDAWAVAARTLRHEPDFFSDVARELLREGKMKETGVNPAIGSPVDRLETLARRVNDVLKEMGKMPAGGAKA
jgi:hypothetical protein